jgi:hypothetical protein
LSRRFPAIPCAACLTKRPQALVDGVLVRPDRQPRVRLAD